MQLLRKGDHLTEDQVLNLCNKAKEILIEESNVQRVETPVTVCYLKSIIKLIIVFDSCVETFMDSFMICWSCFGSAGSVQM